MKHIVITIYLLTVAVMVQAQVTIKDAWVRGTVPQQKASGAFMQLSSKQEIRLVGAKSPVAAVVELHEMVMQEDVMKMRQIPGIDIVPGRVIELKPGGYHVMLIDLKGQLKGGDMVPIALVFEDLKTKVRFTKDINAPVTALGHGNGPSPAGLMAHKP